MAERYFIRRGANVVGPVDAAKLKEGLRDRKIRTSDGVATQKGGPFTKLSLVLSEVLSGSWDGRRPATFQPAEGTFQPAEGTFDVPAEPEAELEAADDSDELPFDADDLESLHDLPPVSGGLAAGSPGGFAETPPPYGDRGPVDGFGWLLNPKGFLSGPVYSYGNSRYPAAAAMVRYFALAAKINYWIGRVITLLIPVATLLFVILAARAGGPGGAVTARGVTMVITVLVGAGAFVILTLLNSFWLVGSLATCELVVAQLSVERSVRQ